MALNARGVPRFLPTLTEIVLPPDLPPDPAPDAPPDTVLDADAIVDRVRLQVEMLMDGRLQELVSSAMLGQVDTIAERLRQEIEPMLRQVIEEAVTYELGLRRRT